MKTSTLIIIGIIAIIGISYLGISWYVAVENELDCNRPGSRCITLPVEKPNVTIIQGSTIMKHNLSPSEITIEVGKQVTWYNDDDASHWIDADDGSWSSGLIFPQSYFTMKFEKAGIYTYHGQPWITGTVIVTEKRNELEDMWITDEDYCGDWCNQEELYRLGCDKPILSHLTRYSNLLDEEFNGTYMIDLIGLPDGVSQEKFEKCVDVIFEKRLPSSADYAFSKLNKTNACTDEPSICYGTFENNTSIRIRCDFVTHGCGPVSFDRIDRDVTDEDKK